MKQRSLETQQEQAVHAAANTGAARSAKAAFIKAETELADVARLVLGLQAHYAYVEDLLARPTLKEYYSHVDLNISAYYD